MPRDSYGTLLAIAAVLLVTTAALAADFTVRDLPRVRCVSNYLFGEGSHDVAAWERDFDRMKQCSLNTVWMVNVWAEYQPSVEPEQWRGDLLAKLRRICAAAQQRGMWVVLPLAYIGEGWGPKGVDAAVWPLIEKQRQQHLDFLRRIARETSGFGNVFYLLCTEEILPGTLLYAPNKREECIASFREWARQAHPDIAYWNERWGGTYTWETLIPPDTKGRSRWQMWADLQRWDAWLMRRLLPPMVAAIREGHPGAVIGLHDFLTPIGLDLTGADGSLPSPNPFDFYSIGYYYDHGMKGGLAGNQAEMRRRVQSVKSMYPAMPLFCGELGLDVRKQPPDARAGDERLQAEFLTGAMRYLGEQQVGFSLWDWRTVVPTAERTHSLVREDGTETPVLVRMRRAG
jgi:hypothetical protein